MVDMQLGEGHEFLGNTRQVFEKHYLDPTLTDAPATLPPEL